MEIRSIVCLEGLYEIGEDGSVFSCEKYCINNGTKVLRRRKQVKPYDNGTGYMQYKLSDNGRVVRYYAHVLVAMAFIGEKPPGMEVNHLDGDRKNNHYSNLEYVTHQENMIYARNKVIYKRAEFVPKCLLLSVGRTMKEVARLLNVSPTLVSKVLRENGFDFSKLLVVKPVGVRRVDRPSKEQLNELLSSSNFASVGRSYGVTCNAVRKWCKSYGMPTHSSAYVKHS